MAEAHIPEHLRSRFEALCGELRDAGVDVVAVLAAYSREGAHFSTRLSVSDHPSAHVAQAHVVCDAVREIMVEWSNSVHGDQLVWADRTRSVT